MAAAVYSVAEMVEKTGVSDWSIYKSVKTGTCPFPYLWISRRLLFPKSKVDEILGIAPDASEASL